MKKVVGTVVIIIVVALVAVLVTAYFTMGKIVRTGIEVIGPDATGVTVNVENVDVSLLGGSVGIDRFVMGNPPGFSADKSFSVNTFDVAVDISSVLSDVVVVKNILIDGAHITWEGFTGDNHKKIMQNIDAYAARFEKEGAPQETKEEGAPAKKVIINDFVLRNSALDFVVADKKIATIPVPDLHLTDIGKKTGGETVGEAIKQTYRQIIAAVGKSVDSNSALIQKKFSELGVKGKELLEQGSKLIEKGKGSLEEKSEDLTKAKEAAAKTVDETVKGLEDVKKGVGDLFKKK